VGFAIQLRRADARGEDVRWRYHRRLAGVAGFGVLTGVLIGATYLIDYAWAGIWLLFIRRWSTRTLLYALVVGTTLIGVWNVAVGSYQWATIGAERANALYRAPHPRSPERIAAERELHAAEAGTRLVKLDEARLEWVIHGPSADFFGDWKRGVRGVLLDSLARALSIFLIGLLLVREGVFDRPDEHRRLLFGMMLVGIALWAANHLYVRLPAGAIASERVAAALSSGLGLFQDGYLALTYVAAITLLVATSSVWKRRLTTMFGAAGRMALTNYILQFAVIAVIFDNYALGATWLEPKYAPLAGVALFAVLAVLSRWWLARFRLGPAEWLLRSLTYARLQPLRRAKAQAWR